MVRDLADQREMETEVYRPAEDSALLADTAIERIKSNRDETGNRPERVLEVGTGTGFVADRISSNTGIDVVGSDINPFACERARKRGVPVIRADLVAPFVADAFDAIVFNPPYLPTDPDTEWNDWMERALSGGKTGRKVIDRFLGDVGRVLAPDGVVLVLVSSVTGVEQVVERAGQNGFSAVAVRDESFPYETLTVLELHQ